MDAPSLPLPSVTLLKAAVLVALLAFSLPAMAQHDEEWDRIMQALAEDYDDAAADDDAAEAFQAQMEELAALHDNPLDLNRCSRDDLLALPFLDDDEVDAVIDYRTLHGTIRSVSELLLVGRLSTTHARWLQLFVEVLPADVAARGSRPPSSRHDLMTRLDIPLYERQGWPWAQGIANRLRYTGQWNNHWDVGLRAEKDSGEPIFNRQNPFYDAWGGHVMFKDWKWLRTLIIGDFQVSFGEGLVMNTAFHLGKQVSALWRTASSLRPHRSTDECRFLRGAAATIDLSREWTVTALYSYRSLDATVQADNTVRSINSTGLHRTASELSHKGTLGNHTAALHAQWHKPRGHLGATAAFLRYDHQFSQGTSLYRQIYPEGYLFGVAGVDYSFHSNHFHVHGETAYSLSASSPSLSSSPSRGSVVGGFPADARSSRGGWAMLNKAVWRFNANTHLGLVQRFYAKDFISPHAQAFGENSRVQNESGLCLFFEADRLGPFALHALFDWFYHPWPRFTMTRSSQGCEAACALTWQPRKGSTWLLRYNLRNKEQSDVRHFSHRLRLTHTRQLGSLWTLTATAIGHRYVEPQTGTVSNGFTLFPKIDYGSRDGQWRCSLLLAWFNTHDYDSRLYIYEPGLYQSFNWSMIYGRGERAAATVRWQSPASVGRQRLRWHWQAKVGLTHYDDRDAISSGPLLVRSPWKADVSLLARLRF